MKGNKIKYPFFTLSLVLVGAIVFGIASSAEEKKEYKYAFENPELSALERATDLVDQMTLQEKVSQMRYDAPAVPRLGIPKYNWWNECLHGVGRAGEATIFPQAIGMGATWNSNLMSEIGTVISDEARAKHHKFAEEGKRGIYQGLTFWTPNINIFRDPRWGRGQETYGEDPYLTGEMAVEFINALQGDDEKYLKLVATAKHFAVHSGPEKTRHSDNYKVSNIDLNETYLPAFKAAIKEANVESVMCAYNRFRDEACCGSNILLDSILRKEWGFDGYVVSDCWAINDFYMDGRHGVSANAQEASALAVKTGTDLNCGNTFDPNLSEAVLASLIDEGQVSRALTRLMTARFKLGMFDNSDNNPYAQIPYEVVRSEKHLNLSLEAARQSMVLLKNQDNLLPLSKDLKSIAVIGPNANTPQALLGNYHGTSPNYNTPLKAIKEKLPNTTIRYAIGADITKEWPLLTAIPAENLRSNGTKGLKAQYFPNENWSGDAVLERQDEEVDFIWIKRPIDIPTDTFTVRWTGQIVPEESGEYRIGLRACNVGKLSINGERVIEFHDDHQPTMRYHDIKLEAGKAIDIQIDYYNFHADPQVQLLWSKLGEDLLSPAVSIAKQSDMILLFLGLSPDIEGEEMPVTMEGFDKGDRSDIRLPSSQRELMKAMVDTGKPVVLVLLNGSALAINYAAEEVPAILEAWYPGEFGGQAISDVLFGDYNPGGKLPLTFYQSVEDLPEFDSYDMENRTYKYFEGTSVFPFGHGLSYTDFEYSNFNIENKMDSQNGLELSVDLKNTGKLEGDEVIQVYLSIPGAENFPIRKLVAFQRVSLSANATETIKLRIDQDQLKTFDEDGMELDIDQNVSISIGGKQPNQQGLGDAKSTQVLTKQIKI